MNDERIRRCHDADLDAICAIVNDGAQQYRGHVPADCLHDPYMAREELQSEIAAGVQFWGCDRAGVLLGVMGLQYRRDVTLIRHAYVRSEHRREGIGGRLLSQLFSLARGRVLVGTWAGATWAVAFYERHGFRLVDAEEKDRLLRVYWEISDRQIETSVVLVKEAWDR